MRMTAILIPDPMGGYAADNPEKGTTLQGETVEEALANLRQAAELYPEEFPSRLVGNLIIMTFEPATNT